MPWPPLPPGKDPVPIVREAGWAPGPVWIGAENLAPTGIWSPDLPARNESLYQLRYPQLQQTCEFLCKELSDARAFKVKIKLLYKHVMELNVSHFLSCKTYSESSTSLSDWHMLKCKFVSINQQLQNYFPSSYGDFTTGQMNSKCSKIPMALNFV